MKSVRPFRRVGNVLLYEDEPVFLAGALPGNVELPEPVEAKLEPLAANRNNFFRHWMIAYYHYSIPRPDPDPTPGAPFLPDHNGRERNSPFFYDRTLNPPKWRLVRYNEDYFRRLRLTIEAAAARGIVVEISLFDAAGLVLAGSDGQKRWPHNPFNSANNMNGVIAEDPNDSNATGFPEWFQPNPTLRSIQAAYVRKVVNEVKGYWNVTFEIMNEPRDAGIAERVAWGDFITGEIVAAYGATPRKQLIFWNSHPPNGQDLKTWKTTNPGSYAQIDGATFHGDTTMLDPNSAELSPLRSDKVFQASSDTGPQPERNQQDWNRRAANRCSALDMAFQAWSVDSPATVDKPATEAGKGIGLAAPPPSPLLEPAFLYEWRKVAEAPPSPIPDDLHVRFFADRSFLTFLPGPPYTELEPGYLRDYLGGRKLPFYYFPRPVNQVEGIWRYEFLDGGATLRLIRESDGQRQDFARQPQATPEALAPFLYHWEKVAESPPGPSLDHFHLRFYRDGSYRGFLVNPLRPLPGGEVRAIQGNRVTLTTRDAARQDDFTFAFRNQGTEVLFDLTRVSDNFRQTFVRRPRPAGDALLPLLYRWDKIAGTRYRLRFFADGSFNSRSLDAPYAELERGEVRAYVAPQGTVPGRLTLWSHTRGAERIVDVKFSVVSGTQGNLARRLELSGEAFRRDT